MPPGASDLCEGRFRRRMVAGSSTTISRMPSPEHSKPSVAAHVQDKHRLENHVADLLSRLARWKSKFALFTRQELELETAKAMDRSLAMPDDRELKFKLLVMASVLKRLPKDHRPSGFSRFWQAIQADTVAEIADVFLSNPLNIPAEIDDQELTALVER